MVSVLWQHGQTASNSVFSMYAPFFRWGSAPHPGSVACGDPYAPRRSLAGRAVRGLGEGSAPNPRLRSSSYGEARRSLAWWLCQTKAA